MSDEVHSHSPKIDTTVPHGARIWNYWLGGKDHYPVDRAAGERVLETFPGMVDIARQSRYFLARAVRFLAGEAGIRQFLDIGTGLPTADNTHETAQRVAPDSRVVYVDNDPLVLVHAQALLVSDPRGATNYVDADIREPSKIVRAAAETLDFSQPIGLMMLGVLGHVADYDEARAAVKHLVASIPSGSYVVINDGTDTDKARETAIRRHNAQHERGGAAATYQVRSPEQIAAYFEGLQVLEPGVVSTSQWRPEHSPFGTPAVVDAYCGVAFKP